MSFFFLFFISLIVCHVFILDCKYGNTLFFLSEIQSNSDSSKQSFTTRMGTRCLQTAVQISDMAFWLCLTGFTCSCSASSSSSACSPFTKQHVLPQPHQPSLPHVYEVMQWYLQPFHPWLLSHLINASNYTHLGVMGFIRAQISAKLEPCKWYLCEYCGTQEGNI